MKTLLKRLAVTSVALVLLSVVAVAQNENNTKEIKSSSNGVTVSMNQVIINQSGIVYVVITLEEGYENPFLIYNGPNSDTNSFIDGEIFTARITILNGDYCVRIEAKSGFKEARTETIYVKAMMKYMNLKLADNSIRNQGVPIIITVNPK